MQIQRLQWKGFACAGKEVSRSIGGERWSLVRHLLRVVLDCNEDQIRFCGLCTPTMSTRPPDVCKSHPRAPVRRFAARPATNAGASSRHALAMRSPSARGAQARPMAIVHMSSPLQCPSALNAAMRGRTRTRHSDSPLLVTVANNVLRGLGASARTSSLGSGSAGALESCLAADVGKYILPTRPESKLKPKPERTH